MSPYVFSDVPREERLHQRFLLTSMDGTCMEHVQSICIYHHICCSLQSGLSIEFSCVLKNEDVNTLSFWRTEKIQLSLCRFLTISGMWISGLRSVECGPVDFGFRKKEKNGFSLVYFYF